MRGTDSSWTRCSLEKAQTHWTFRWRFGSASGWRFATREGGSSSGDNVDGRSIQEEVGSGRSSGLRARHGSRTNAHAAAGSSGLEGSGRSSRGDRIGSSGRNGSDGMHEAAALWRVHFRTTRRLHRHVCCCHPLLLLLLEQWLRWGPLAAARPLAPVAAIWSLPAPSARHRY